jgi:predicted  nucleic acid-binding Zn-ribbon protein
MAEKDLGEMTENFEEEIENLKNKEFRLFGIKVTAVTVGAAMTLISTGIGGLYGAFVVYQDYMDMKEQIQSYVAPDLSGFQEQISVLQERMIGVEDSVIMSTDYTREIRNDLKADITQIETEMSDLEDSVDESERRIRDLRSSIEDTLALIRTENSTALREVETVMRESEKDARDTMRETEERIDQSMRTLEEELNITIQRALDNPLNN